PVAFRRTIDREIGLAVTVKVSTRAYRHHVEVARVAADYLNIVNADASRTNAAVTTHTDTELDRLAICCCRQVRFDVFVPTGIAAPGLAAVKRIGSSIAHTSCEVSKRIGIRIGYKGPAGRQNILEAAGADLDLEHCTIPSILGQVVDLKLDARRGARNIKCRRN